MKTGFQSNPLSLTGTEVALYDYAHHNERELLNQSVIFYQRGHPGNDELAIKRFQARFEVIPYNDIADLDRGSVSSGCDLLYAIKSGKKIALFRASFPQWCMPFFLQIRCKFTVLPTRTSHRGCPNIAPLVLSQRFLIL